jgi:hypothetical protein
MLQAVLFYKDYWNATRAREHLNKEKLKPIKRVHITDKYYRYRIAEPDYKNYTYIIKRGKNHIDYIIGIKK